MQKHDASSCFRRCASSGFIRCRRPRVVAHIIETLIGHVRGVGPFHDRAVVADIHRQIAGQVLFIHRITISMVLLLATTILSWLTACTTINYALIVLLVR